MMLRKANASLQDLKEIRSFIRDQALGHRIDPSVVYDIQLAVTEAVSNTLIHGYHGKPGLVEVSIETNKDMVVVSLRDEASYFDPTRVPSPDLEAPLTERPLGGLGIFLIKENTEQMIYRALPDGGNELTLLIKGVVEVDQE